MCVHTYMISGPFLPRGVYLCVCVCVCVCDVYLCVCVSRHIDTDRQTKTDTGTDIGTDIDTDIHIDTDIDTETDRMVGNLSKIRVRPNIYIFVYK